VAPTHPGQSCPLTLAQYDGLAGGHGSSFFRMTSFSLQHSAMRECLLLPASELQAHQRSQLEKIEVGDRHARYPTKRFGFLGIFDGQLDLVEPFGR